MIKTTLATAIAATFVATAAVAAPVSQADLPAGAQSVAPITVFDKVMKPKILRPKCPSTCRLDEDTNDRFSTANSRRRGSKSFIIGITRNKGISKPKPKKVFPSRN